MNSEKYENLLLLFFLDWKNLVETFTPNEDSCLLNSRNTSTYDSAPSFGRFYHVHIIIFVDLVLKIRMNSNF